MATDDDWIADVQRWCLGARGGEAWQGDDDLLGYEAALPALQARHWPDAPASRGFAPTPGIPAPPQAP